MQLECEVHQVIAKQDVDGNPYVQISLKTNNPLALTIGAYKFKGKTIKLKVLNPLQ